MSMSREQFRKIAAEVAIVLSQHRDEDWTVTSEDSLEWSFGADVSGPDGARLYLSYGQYSTHKVTIEGKFPDDGLGHVVLRANVDPARGAVVIAREASRRVLNAGYLQELPGVLERKAQHDQEDSERAAWLAKAAALFGLPAPDGKLYLGGYVAGNGHVESYWRGSDRMNINLSGIPAVTMLRMLEVLAKDCGVSPS